MFKTHLSTICLIMFNNDSNLFYYSVPGDQIRVHEFAGVFQKHFFSYANCIAFVGKSIAYTAQKRVFFCSEQI